MEIISMVLTILLVLLLVMVSAKAYRNRHEIPFYLKLRALIKKPKPGPLLPPTTRMFVAIRRQPAGRMALSSANGEEYEATREQINKQLQELLAGWASMTVFTFGFHGSEYGLPSSNDENWLLFASFEAANHDVYRACLSFLGGEQFFALRNQFDIRLLYGEMMEDLRNHMDELFN